MAIESEIRPGPEQRIHSLSSRLFRPSRKEVLLAGLGAAGLYLIGIDSAAAYSGPAILRPPKPDKRFIDFERPTNLGLQKRRYYPDDNMGDVLMEFNEDLLVDLKAQSLRTEAKVASLVDLFEQSEYDLQINTVALYRPYSPMPFVFGVDFGKIRNTLALAAIGLLNEDEAAEVRSIAMSWSAEYITSFGAYDAEKEKLPYRPNIRNLKSADPAL